MFYGDGESHSIFYNAARNFQTWCWKLSCMCWLVESHFILHSNAEYLARDSRYCGGRVVIIIPPVDRSSVMSQVLVGWLPPPISGGHDANDAATGSGRVALPLPPTFNFSLLIILFVTTATATEKLWNNCSTSVHTWNTCSCNVYAPMLILYPG